MHVRRGEYIGVAPESQLLKTTLTGSAVTRTDRLGKADVIRGSAPIYASPDSDAVTGAVTQQLVGAERERRADEDRESARS